MGKRQPNISASLRNIRNTLFRTNDRGFFLGLPSPYQSPFSHDGDHDDVFVFSSIFDFVFVFDPVFAQPADEKLCACTGTFTTQAIVNEFQNLLKSVQINIRFTRLHLSFD